MPQPPGPIQPLDESSDEIAALTEDDLRALRAEKTAAQPRRSPAAKPPPDTVSDAVEDSAGDGPSAPVSEDDILGALDDASRKNVPRVYKPGEIRPGKAAGPSGSKEYEAYQLKMKAIASSLDRLDEKSCTLADKPARVGMMFVFTGARGAEAAWAKLAEDLRKYSTKQVKEVSGVTQVNIGTMLPPRKILELIRTLKSAGGIFRTYKAEADEVQKWLTEHLK